MPPLCARLWAFGTGWLIDVARCVAKMAHYYDPGSPDFRMMSQFLNSSLVALIRSNVKPKYVWLHRAGKIGDYCLLGASCAGDLKPSEGTTLRIYLLK